SGDASQGLYQVQVKLENNEVPVSRSVDVIVEISQQKININAPQNEFFKSLPSFVIGETKININNAVDQLINEIQSLENAQNYNYMIAAYRSQWMELYIDKLIIEKNLTNHGNPKQKLKFPVEQRPVQKHSLTRSCEGENRLQCRATKNFLSSIESERL